MAPQPPPSKRPLFRSPNQALHSAPGHHRSPKRSKNVATVDQHVYDPSLGPTLDPTPDPTRDPTGTDTLNLKLVSWLSKMSVKDPWLQKLLRKVGEGELSESELEEYNRYIDQALTAIETRPQSPPKPSPMEDFLSSRRTAKELRSNQYSSSKPPVQPALERQMAPAIPAFTMPATQHPRSHPTLFMSPEPDLDAAKTISSTREHGQIADAFVDPFIKTLQRSFNRSGIFAEQSHAVHIEKSTDSVQTIILAGENTSNPSTKYMQPPASPLVSRAASQQWFNVERNGDIARSSSVIGHGALSPSIRPTKHSANDTSTSWIRQHKARASSGQAGKGKAVHDAVEDKDEDAKFFAKYEKKKPTNQDLAKYRQGQALPLAQRSEAEFMQEILVRQGVEMEENEPYERRVLKENFGLAGPSVDRMMKTKFGTRRPSPEKSRSNIEQQKPSVGSAELERHKTKVQKLREKISLKGEVISEQNATIDKLRGEVKLLKRTQRRSSELDHDLTKAIEHQDEREAEIQQLKAQLAAAKGDLENTQGLILEYKGRYEGQLKAREMTDAEIEAANLRDENAALKKTVASLRSQNDPFVGHHFAHKNLFASPLVCASIPIRGPRSQAPAAPVHRRGRPAKAVQEAASDEEDSGEGSVYREGTSSEGEMGEVEDEEREGAREEGWEDGVMSEEEVWSTKNERGMMALDGWLAIPANPKPVRLEGLLGYRDGTRVRRVSLDSRLNANLCFSRMREGACLGRRRCTRWAATWPGNCDDGMFLASSFLFACDMRRSLMVSCESQR